MHRALVVVAAAAVPALLYAAAVGPLTPFVNGTVADADAVNANFAALRTAVDDNDARIVALETAAGTAASPAESCLALHQARPSLPSGPYFIATGGTSGTKELYCDMDGGWTLVGQVDGRHDLFGTWLVADANPAALTDRDIESATWASVDARTLAVERATELRLSNTNVTHWVSWPLPGGRTLSTWWNHGAGHATIEPATDHAVTVTAWNGGSVSCLQNDYGILPLQAHGGSYPSVYVVASGGTAPGDFCFSVQTALGSANGFSQNGNGGDAPGSESDWPNAAINQAPSLSVWLR
jgi:hypothetical protein